MSEDLRRQRHHVGGAARTRYRHHGAQTRLNPSSENYPKLRDDMLMREVRAGLEASLRDNQILGKIANIVPKRLDNGIEGRARLVIKIQKSVRTDIAASLDEEQIIANALSKTNGTESNRQLIDAAIAINNVLTKGQAATLASDLGNSGRDHTGPIAQPAESAGEITEADIVTGAIFVSDSDGNGTFDGRRLGPEGCITIQSVRENHMRGEGIVIEYSFNDEDNLGGAGTTYEKAKLLDRMRGLIKQGSS